ncbi:aldehyde dehydrogenase family protein [Puniceicoccales bacterium CK1056]|uniref:Aldehyde dehydrogenase family protein n=1 Tax=Oceanipulchritudo coccoides TaxID=2706888 RepID=A0A6B2M1G5_9BACT|nr:aldehyde dehydrogenase [Oceanipulchritudo coccoides]NDV62851.1 aldehyde dehydrogenase family protein [Oceanipulchritudo coccoides]
MSQIDEAALRSVVTEVLSKLQSSRAAVVTPSIQSKPGRHGVFDDAASAGRAARGGFEQLKKTGWAGRAKVVEIVKRMCAENAVRWGTIEFEETKIGRLEHKIEKLQGIRNVLGTEYLVPHGMSGDAGITMDESAPWGVIGAISPVTHSIPTIAGNIVNMVAAGNAVVVNPHPGGAACAAVAIDEFNEAIKAELGIENLVCTVEKPSLESFNELCASEDVNMLCITGGPAVVDAAMKTGKRAICAGPGNPPVVVDDCSALDFDKVAKDIIIGGGYDNNLLCIGEKQVFVVGNSYKPFMDSMKRAGAVLLTKAQLEAIKKEVFDVKDGGGGCSHAVLNRAYVGADAAKLAAIAGLKVDPKTEMLIAETADDDLFVIEEQMMPLLPIVRSSTFDDAVRMAKASEHGYKHSAMVHTMNVSRMTQMGREMDTTIFVKNGPCVAGLGLGGEGYISFSIATTTGEGITTPRTFTRFRRCTLVDQLNII